MDKSRLDDYKSRRKHLEQLSEKELENRFWELAEKIVEPMIDLAKTSTTPSIERSVLLRMGFSSMESQAIVNKVMEHNLLGKGAGHIIWRAAKDKKIDIRKAGLMLADGDEELWQYVEQIFKGGNNS